MDSRDNTGRRKLQHIDICAEQDVESTDRNTGFGGIHLRTISLPELDYNSIDTHQDFLGTKFRLPILITGMTGGVEKGAEINNNLAAAATHLGIPMGIGSQRLALENPALASIFRVKTKFPNLFLIGNIGCSQLPDVTGNDGVKILIDMIQADALAIHVNILQELVQEEGDRRFKGILSHIESVCRQSPVPVIVKEVGHGLDAQTAQRLVDAGVAAVDVGGSGGTSWAYIEGLRSNSQICQRAAQVFRNWGIPTALALQQARASVEGRVPVIATGGIRDGLMVAKAIALGASLVGVGLPLMRAALKNSDAVIELLQCFENELRIAMLCSGSSKLCELPLALAVPDERGFGK